MGRISDVAGFTLRIFNKDQNPDLMAQYLTGGKEIIPIFSFIDARGGRWEEVARFIERPVLSHQLVQQEKTRLPEPDHPDYDAERKAMYARIRERYRADDSYRQATVREIRELLTPLVED